MKYLAILLFAVSANASDIGGRITISGARNNANAVIYIERIPGKTFSPPRDPVRLDQVNLKFDPHVLPILVGTRVAFPNSDEIRHNVFSPDPPKFNLGTYPVVQTRSQVFGTPGVFTLLCNVHAEMSAFIIVSETPYWAVSDPAGNYTIPNVPNGRYVLKVWHERFKPQSFDIEITGSNIIRNFQLRR